VCRMPCRKLAGRVCSTAEPRLFDCGTATVELLAFGCVWRAFGAGILAAMRISGKLHAPLSAFWPPVIVSRHHADTTTTLLGWHVPAFVRR
jgi:hypothetical protein